MWQIRLAQLNGRQDARTQLKNAVAEYPRGFQHGKSSIRQISLVKQILEKCWECSINVPSNCRAYQAGIRRYRSPDTGQNIFWIWSSKEFEQIIRMTMSKFSAEVFQNWKMLVDLNRMLPHKPSQIVAYAEHMKTYIYKNLSELIITLDDTRFSPLELNWWCQLTCSYMYGISSATSNRMDCGLFRRSCQAYLIMCGVAGFTQYDVNSEQGRRGKHQRFRTSRRQENFWA